MNTTNRTTNSAEKFIATIIPLIEQHNPNYICEGLLPVPLAIYYGKKDGEYIFDLLDLEDCMGACGYDQDGDSTSLSDEEVGPY